MTYTPRPVVSHSTELVISIFWAEYNTALFAQYLHEFYRDHQLTAWTVTVTLIGGHLHYKATQKIEAVIQQPGDISCCLEIPNA